MRACRPARVGAGHAAFQQPYQECLLGMQAVLRLVPHRALRAVNDLVGDLGGPRCARQCRTTAPGSARSNRSPLSWKGRKGRTGRGRLLLPHRRPGVGHQHVGTVGRRQWIGCHRHRSTVSLARRRAASTNCGSGRSAGAAMVTWMPAVTPPSISECAMLLAPSPKYANLSPYSVPRRSSRV